MDSIEWQRCCGVEDRSEECLFCSKVGIMKVKVVPETQKRGRTSAR